MNYSILEHSWGISLTLYNLSDIADIRKGYSGNMAGNPNFDIYLSILIFLDTFSLYRNIYRSIIRIYLIIINLN